MGKTNVSSGTCPPQFASSPSRHRVRRDSAVPSAVGSGAPGVPCYAMRSGWGALVAHVSWRFVDALYSLQG